MTYIDGFLAAVPNANKQAYIDMAKRVVKIFRDHGALRCVENWGDDVPEGQLTSFTMAMQRKEDETVVFSWIEWPSKEVRDTNWPAVMEAFKNDPDMADSKTIFDGKRMIFGGFQTILEA